MADLGFRTNKKEKAPRSEGSPEGLRSQYIFSKICNSVSRGSLSPQRITLVPLDLGVGIREVRKDG